MSVKLIDAENKILKTETVSETIDRINATFESLQNTTLAAATEDSRGAVRIDKNESGLEFITKPVLGPDGTVTGTTTDDGKIRVKTGPGLQIDQNGALKVKRDNTLKFNDNYLSVAPANEYKLGGVRGFSTPGLKFTGTITANSATLEDFILQELDIFKKTYNSWDQVASIEWNEDNYWTWISQAVAEAIYNAEDKKYVRQDNDTTALKIILHPKDKNLTNSSLFIKTFDEENASMDVEVPYNFGMDGIIQEVVALDLVGVNKDTNIEKITVQDDETKVIAPETTPLGVLYNKGADTQTKIIYLLIKNKFFALCEEAPGQNMGQKVIRARKYYTYSNFLIKDANEKPMKYGLYTLQPNEEAATYPNTFMIDYYGFVQELNKNNAFFTNSDFINNLKLAMGIISSTGLGDLSSGGLGQGQAAPGTYFLVVQLRSNTTTTEQTLTEQNALKWAKAYSNAINENNLLYCLTSTYSDFGVGVKYSVSYSGDTPTFKQGAHSYTAPGYVVLPVAFKNKIITADYCNYYRTSYDLSKRKPVYVSKYVQGSSQILVPFASLTFTDNVADLQISAKTSVLSADNSSQENYYEGIRVVKGGALIFQLTVEDKK